MSDRDMDSERGFQPTLKRFKPIPFQLSSSSTNSRGYRKIPDNEELPLEPSSSSKKLPKKVRLSATAYPSAIPTNRTTDQVNIYCISLYLATLLFAITLVYAVIALTQSFTCLGPPYLYVTTKGSTNIWKFSRDGCLIHEKILWGMANQDSDLRDMSMGKYMGKEALFVADSRYGKSLIPLTQLSASQFSLHFSIYAYIKYSANHSGVIVFGECFPSTSLRPYIARAVSTATNPGTPAAVAHSEILAIIVFSHRLFFLSFQALNTHTASQLTPSPTTSWRHSPTLTSSCGSKPTRLSLILPALD